MTTSLIASATSVHPRCQTPLDRRWRFCLGDQPEAAGEALDDGGWEEVHLPHDWAIGAPFDSSLPQGQAQGFLRQRQVGWYRRRFATPIGAQRVRVRFDGVYRNARVFINGHDLGERPYGYASFHHDLTPWLRPDGDNLLAVRVDNHSTDGCRWYSGSGIWRRVWLECSGATSVAPWGVQVTTPVITSASASVRVAVDLEHRGPAITVCVEADIRDADGAMVANAEPTSIALTDVGGQVVITLHVSTPRRWSIETPHLYRACMRLYDNGHLIDEVQTVFGVRTLTVDAEHGCRLNGQPIKLKGVNLHHDAGCLGAMFFSAAWERRLQRLKTLGCNTIRCSHNPPDPAFLDLCDRLGFLVINEAFDKWLDGCFGKTFPQWWRDDLDALVRRDRNHPSVAIWSVGNEIHFQESAETAEILARLATRVRELDSTRPVTIAMHPHCVPQDVWDSPVDRKVAITLALAKHVDLIGGNYMEPWFDAYHAADPTLAILSTEAHGYWRYRGNALSARSLVPENPWFDVANRPFVIGQCLWTGIDYLGEAARGWPVKGWAGAPIDTAGFFKPHAWFQQSVWTEAPMVRITVRHGPAFTHAYDNWSWPALTAHWNLDLPRGEVVELWVFSNCDEIELERDGKRHGRQRPADARNRICTWNLPWQPGCLIAIGYRAGVEVCRHELRTAGAPARLALTVDRHRLHADGQDLAHVEVQVVDAEGLPVPGVKLPLGFVVEGPWRLIGVDNGDLTCMESYQGNRRTTSDGRCLAVLRVGWQPGVGTIRVICPQIPTAAIDVVIAPAGLSTASANGVGPTQP